MKPLRIAMLAHSTNPRGGVVHAMELSQALTERGHSVVLHAPDPYGRGFFRQGKYQQRILPCEPARPGLYDMVLQRVQDYAAYFARHAVRRQFDIYHAHDAFSGNAMAVLAQWGMIAGYVRTVHHMDAWSDDRLEELQLRSINHADRIFCVSRTWQQHLAAEHAIPATVMPTGVDLARFSPHPAAQDQELRTRLGLRPRAKVFLCMGGVEPRKNTINILRAFAGFHATHPDSQLLIAGGKTLLDHAAYVAQFEATLAAMSLKTGPGQDVILAGPMPDQAVPTLYRLADALVFASVKEGFGLVVLEALASGTPVILSEIAPFTEYMQPGACLWVDPLDPLSISSAMQRVLRAVLAQRLRQEGPALAAAFRWSDSARAHEEGYAAVLPGHSLNFFPGDVYARDAV